MSIAIRSNSRGSVNVLMVHIWCVGMSVGHRFMSVLVTVAALWHHIMHMRMVPIVVPVGMLMLKHFMCVLVTMAFRQVQYHARQHQDAA